MKKWRRKLTATACAITMVLCLVACAETPEESVVVDKSNGLPEKSVLPVETENPKDLGIPDVWSETITNSDDYITLVADYEMELPEVYNTPVYAYEMANISSELLTQLCDYFSDGNELYQNPAMTKEQLEVEKEALINGAGNWSYYDVTERSDIEGIIEELISTAPSEVEYAYTEAQLDMPVQTELEYAKSQYGGVSARYSEYFFEEDGAAGMKVRVDNGAEVTPYIYAMDYNPEIGSTSNFLYQQGIYLDELELEEDRTNQTILNIGDEYEAYLTSLETAMDEMDTASFTEDMALEMTEQVLADLSLEGYGVTDICKAIGNSSSESWAGVQAESITDTGYSIYYSLQAGDVMGYEQPFQQPFDDLPETVYAPSFSTETIHMIVTDDGVQMFEWNNLSTMKEVIAENTALLSFDEIKEQLNNHLLYTALSSFGEDSKTAGDLNYYEVKNVELRAANIPAYEDTNAVWLAPVWVIEVSREVKFATQDEAWALPDMIIVLNAIDGGYVRPRIDLRIQV